MNSRTRIVMPYVEAAHQGGRQRPSALLVRSIDVPSTAGNALHVANWWHKEASPASAVTHVIVDEKQAYRCVEPRRQAGNIDKGLLAVTVCMPDDDSAEWYRIVNSELFSTAADVVAQLCADHHIRQWQMSAKQYERWNKLKVRPFGGLTYDMHGSWPQAAFTRVVRRRAQHFKEARHAAR